MYNYLVKECEVLIIDSFVEELKVGPQYDQAIPAREGFLNPANIIATFRYDVRVQLVG